MKNDQDIDRVIEAVLAGRDVGWDACYVSDTEMERAYLRMAFHGVVPLMHERSDRISGLPAALKERLRRESLRQQLWEESHFAVLSEALAALQSRGIDHAVLKGSALAYVYYSRPHLRPRGDTDLLVRPTDLGAVRELLSQAGWQCRGAPHGVFHQESWESLPAGGMGHLIDLHWEAVDSPVLQSAVGARDIVAAVEHREYQGLEICIPDPCALILHGLLNQAWHEAFGVFVEGAPGHTGKRLVWTMDNHLLLSSLDVDGWARLTDFARERGMAPLLYAAGNEAVRVLATPVDALAMQSLAEAPRENAVMRYVATPSRGRRWMQDFRATNGIRAKARAVWTEITPPRAHLGREFPQMSKWPLPALWLWRIVRSAKRLIAG